jgi:hypothetical protein
MPGRVYTKQEADAILARAIEMQRGDSTSHEDLVAAAREVGVPAEAIERAAAEVLGQRRDEEDVQALRSRAWRGFYAHLVPYLMVSALLTFINVMTGHFPWVLIVMLGWGIGLASHLLGVAMPDKERLLRQVQRERERARARDLRLARVEASDARVRVEGGPAQVSDEMEEPEEEGSARRQAR